MRLFGDYKTFKNSNTTLYDSKTTINTDKLQKGLGKVNFFLKSYIF